MIYGGWTPHPTQQHNSLWNCTEGPMDRQEHRVERRLAAIFAADVAGYSRLMQQGRGRDAPHLDRSSRRSWTGLIAEHSGRIANTAGDSVLAEFPSAVDAVQCAVACRRHSRQAIQDAPEERRLSSGSGFMSVT